MIEITLTHSGKQIDLLIPGEVTFDRLGRLLREAFAGRGVALPKEFALALGDKALAVNLRGVVNGVTAADGGGGGGGAPGARLQIVTDR